MTGKQYRDIIIALESNRCRSAELVYEMAGRPLPVVTKLLYEHQRLARDRVRLLERAGVADKFGGAA